MFLIFPYVFLLFSLCNGSNKRKPVCDTIKNYEKTILPSSIKTVAKGDYYGAIITVLHQMYVSSFKYWPNPTNDDCKTRNVKMGNMTVKFSMRSRGCCTTCCLIHNTESHLKLYYVNKHIEPAVVNLKKKKKRALSALGVSSRATTILYFHGFSEDGYGGILVKKITEAYLGRNETYNVFKLDYSELAPIPWYVEAIDNCKLIAKAMAKFVIFYDKTGELPIENIHLIGISLGAQLASYVAKEIGKYKKVKRVTGLDPAYPLYQFKDESERLAKTDAEFVDVIHTDPGAYGFPLSVGHADFYIDYPSMPHPGCSLFELLDKGLLGYFITCDHIRSLLLYKESVENPYAFPVVTTTASRKMVGYMGLLANKTTTLGDFHMINIQPKTSL